MPTPELGRLERVELRKIWASESGDFTPWLAREENLKLMSETIGIELEFEAQETGVGPFRADILCKNISDDSWVLIENQLERTDHSHLGQLLTYAAGLEAVTIIWIAERFTEEHRAALDWLNQITGERFAFFGLEIELWQIGNSQAAPKFNIVCSPNNWAKTVQSTASQSIQHSEVKQAQFNFWTAFKKYMEEKKSVVRCTKPFPQHWMNHSIGRSGFQLTSAASTWDTETNQWGTELRVELVTNSAASKAHFALLQQQQEQIEQEIGQPMVWHNPPDAKMCRIYLRKSADFRNSDEWPAQHEWLRVTLEKFRATFAQRIRELDSSKFTETEMNN
mgnify:CR=1 FL=1